MKVALVLLASLAVIALTTSPVSASPQEEEVTTTEATKGWFDKAKEKAKKAAEKVKEAAKTTAKKVKEGVDHVVNKIKGKINKSSNSTTEAPMDTVSNSVVVTDSPDAIPAEDVDANQLDGESTTTTASESEIN